MQKNRSTKRWKRKQAKEWRKEKFLLSNSAPKKKRIKTEVLTLFLCLWKRNENFRREASRHQCQHGFVPAAFVMSYFPQQPKGTTVDNRWRHEKKNKRKCSNTVLIMLLVCIPFLSILFHERSVKVWDIEKNEKTEKNGNRMMHNTTEQDIRWTK